MDGMFTSPSRPFYQSVTIINLQPLSPEKYAEFAVLKFEESGKKLDAAVVWTLYRRFDGVTSYIHRILNILFSRTGMGQACTSDMIEPAIDFIIRLERSSFSVMPQMSE